MYIVFVQAVWKYTINILQLLIGCIISPLLSFVSLLHPPLCSQHDEGKLEELLKEVASTEAPADAPAPPPDQAEPEENTELLPSQRDQGTVFIGMKGTYCGLWDSTPWWPVALSYLSVIIKLTLPTLECRLWWLWLIIIVVFYHISLSLFPSTHTHIHTHTCTVDAADCLSTACTPDELAAVVREIRDNSGLIRSHTHHLVSYKNCFIGRDLVTWLVDKKGISCEFCYGRGFLLQGLYIISNSVKSKTYISFTLKIS